MAVLGMSVVVLVIDALGRIVYAFRARRVDDHAPHRDILASLQP